MKNQSCNHFIKSVCLLFIRSISIVLREMRVRHMNYQMSTVGIEIISITNEPSSVYYVEFKQKKEKHFDHVTLAHHQTIARFFFIILRK
jgi:regulatory protein YycH of two-component signal transduction system YycFG